MRMEERIEFTKEMKKDYTILFPNMADIQFRFLCKVFRGFGYQTELLTETGRRIVDVGLKYVHNDTCYPALLTIGQLIDALDSGRYDVNKTALMMTQTGGGCRASNYIFLLRKALKKAGYGQVPVISINFAGLEKNSGFTWTLPLIRRALAAMIYGDLLMLLANQTRPYEVNKGESDALVEAWITDLSARFEKKQALGQRAMANVMKEIAASFAKIEIQKIPLPKVGIVGEIYVKYSPLGNNELEKFLRSQGCEVMVPGIMGFLQYSVENMLIDVKLYGGSAVRRRILEIVKRYFAGFETALLDAVRSVGCFEAPTPFAEMKRMGEAFIGEGCKMGEGWLLTAEMVELTESGYGNIVCAQPFGCLPNHIVGKGMIRRLKEVYPSSNIVAIDYDPGATKVNQENRIKLMLAVARENLREENGIKKAEGTQKTVPSEEKKQLLTR